MSLLKGISESLNNIRDLDKNSKTKKGEAVKSKASPAANKSSPKAGVAKDSVNISDFAKTLMKNPISVDSLKQELENLKALDKSTLQEIHGKIKSNYYDKPEVIDKIVDEIIPEAHPMEDVLTVEKSDQAAMTEQIRENIQNGKYDSEEVLNTIVDRMLKPDNLLF